MKSKVFLSIEKARDVIKSNSRLNSVEIEELIEQLTNESKGLPEWLVIVIKAIIYVLGLILAGMGTASACEIFNIL